MATREDLVIVPTYNERASILCLLNAPRESVPGADVLVVDDASPDGTGDRVASRAGREPGVLLLRREGPGGPGRSYRTAFRWALARGCERIAHMDADLSHDPLAVPDLLAAAERHDLAIGSLFPAGPVGDAIRTSAGPSSVGYLLVAVGDCAGCIKADLPGWQEQCRARGVSMILLTSASSSAASDFRRRLGLRVPLVSDPSETMQRRLNAVWYGRPYLYSPDWRLRWVPTVLGGDSPFADERLLVALKATDQ